MSDELKSLIRIFMPRQAQWMGIRRTHRQGFAYAFRDGHPEGAMQFEDGGLFLEVLVNGQFGYAAVNSTQPAALAEAVARAVREATSAAPFAVFQADASLRPPSRGEYRSPRIQEPRRHLRREELNELAGLCGALRVSDKIVRATVTLWQQLLHTELASSSGAEIQQEFLVTCVEASAVAQDGPTVQSRSMGGARSTVRQQGLEVLDFARLDEEARRIGEEALELLAAPECPTETLDVILAPDQMVLQLHESIGHPLELDRILGDERNYAGGSFVRREDFGRLQYGSSLLNVTFDPTVPHQLASYAFDDHGTPARKEFLIQNGVLQRALGSVESQRRSGIPGVANARASSFNRAPIDRMANINIEPGSSSMEEMVASIENGVYMEANCSWSIDDFRNKFQFGCEYGRRIRNGKLAEVVRNPNYRGISVPFWNKLFMVGNRDTWQVLGTPNCGKGEPSQVAFVGHAIPACAFRDVEVFGGAK